MPPKNENKGKINFNVKKLTKFLNSAICVDDAEKSLLVFYMNEKSCEKLSLYIYKEPNAVVFANAFIHPLFQDFYFPSGRQTKMLIYSVHINKALT